MPRHLAMIWLSIERVGRRITLLAQVANAAGERLSRRSRDFKSWFRMLRVTSTDIWKCFEFFRGVFYRDERMQMGRVASAHTGQRTSQLITAAMKEEADKLTEQTRISGAMHPTKVEWLVQCEAALGKEVAVEIMQVFQDDLLEIAMWSDMENIIQQIEMETLQGELQVLLSAKPKANKPFSQVFGFIGATFNVSNLHDIRRKPADHIIERLRVQCKSVLARGPGLMDLTKAQELVGCLAFCARFIACGSAKLNSAYACFAAAEYMQLRRNQVMVSDEILEDLRGFWYDISKGHWSPVTVSPEVRVPGLQGAPSDASRLL